MNKKIEMNDECIFLYKQLIILSYFSIMKKIDSVLHSRSKYVQKFIYRFTN